MTWWQILLIIGIVIVVVILIGFIYLMVISEADGGGRKKSHHKEAKEWESFDKNRQKEREAYLKSQREGEANNNKNPFDDDFDWNRFN